MDTSRLPSSEKYIAERIRHEAAVHLTAEAKQRIRQRLLSEYQALKYGDSHTAHIPQARFRTAPVVIAVTAIVIVGAGIGTVSAANSAKPGDPLFVVDQAIERIQLAVTPNQARRAKLLANIAKERGQEHRDLVTDQNANAPAAEQLATDAASRAMTSNDTARAELIEQGNTTAVAELNQIRSEVIAITETPPLDVTNLGLTEAKVTFGQDIATVTLNLNAAVATFQLATKNLTEIENAIAQRTGAELSQIKALLVVDSDDNAMDQLTTNSNPANAQDTNTKTDDWPVNSSDQPTNNANNNSSVPPDQNPDRLAGWNISVAIVNGQAEITIARNELSLFNWTLPTDDVGQIIASISQKTGLSAEQIRSVWHLAAE